ncbi:hypothetical protein [Flavobacterium piscisymbiosum]|uniref:GLPGLI family protein n=1 Tax=Flavobacterium piscisymbiosum TaxID=2893753 RepID=A0ABS8MKI4_9FLAO|nr:hypothetical protein [Flavobacterium sp. F-30]MCC9065195.1 hypothetical protein [Flavobacterium sp. F-30]
MKFKWTLFLLINCFLSSGQTQNVQKINSNVKIYGYKSKAVLINDKDESKIWWLFYKIDWDKKTIQYAQFEFKERDKEPDLSNVTKLFKNSTIDEFVVLNPNKIKVKRERAYRKRAWFDFATPGVKTPSSPARKYCINSDTLVGKNKDLKFVLDKDLTMRYNELKKN